MPNNQQPNSHNKPTVTPISNYSSSVNMRNVSPTPINTYTNQNKNFEAFDFFGQEIAKSSKNISKTPTKIGEIKSS